MSTLIFVFGFWINAQNISYMSNFDKGCYVRFGSSTDITIRDQSCSEVAAEINKQIEDTP